MKRVSDRGRGVVCGLTAAALFGASAPLAKLLLSSVRPLMLAGLLYLGAGLGLSLYRLLCAGRSKHSQPPLQRSDLTQLTGMIVVGGAVGPVLLLFGLQRVSGVTGSLLLNLEAVFTMLLAVILFGEHLGRKEALAALILIVGASFLGHRADVGNSDWLGVFAIAGACLSWGFDNNLTQRLSSRDPTSLVQIKTLAAGLCTLGLARATGQLLPSLKITVAALAVGSVCYGVSIVFDVYALRYLGAAREAAFFALAPFAGAVLAIPLLGQGPTALDYAAAVLMAIGSILMLRARHAHLHPHAQIEHTHEHVHDLHHRHPHPGLDAADEPHSHPHRHSPIEHSHPHVSDIHHRHPHKL